MADLAQQVPTEPFSNLVARLAGRFDAFNQPWVINLGRSNGTWAVFWQTGIVSGLHKGPDLEAVCKEACTAAKTATHAQLYGVR